MKYKTLPDWEYIKNLVLYAEIMNQQKLDVNPKYPDYWRIVKEAVIQ